MMNKVIRTVGDFFWAMAYIFALPSYILQSVGNYFYAIIEEEEEEETDE